MAVDKLDALYRKADENDILVIFCPIPRDSMVISTGSILSIAINSTEYHSQSDELYFMAHEMAHCETGTYYSVASTPRLRAKMEYQADAWMVLHMVTPADLYAAFSDGCTELWQLAERFDLPERIVARALEIYRAKGLL